MENKNIFVLLPVISFVAIIAMFSVYGALAPVENDLVSSGFGCYDSDNGVNPYVKGYCVDYGNIYHYDRGINPTVKYPGGTYAEEYFCMTSEMKQYCKTQNTAAYCDGLANNCYGASLLPPWEVNLAWTYFPFKTEYLCTMGFANGACLVPVCGDGIINGADQCDGKNFGGKTCSSLTAGKFSAGYLSCIGCKISTSTCTVGPVWNG